jgi:hypothetical protein
MATEKHVWCAANGILNLNMVAESTIPIAVSAKSNMHLSSQRTKAPGWLSEMRLKR